ADNMLKGDPSGAKEIVKKMGNHKDTKSHNRHIGKEECKSMGLNIIDLEEMDATKKGECCDLQDCLLTLHHAYMHTFSSSSALKIVENHLGSGNTMIING
ncbi:MAG: hypothetical protein VB081_13000, partial [Christensenella sp.]|nr:hypothetical protein [Christensenella sp.]